MPFPEGALNRLLCVTQNPCALLARAAIGTLLWLALAACQTPKGSPEGADDVIGIGVGAIPGQPGYEEVVRGIDLAIERLHATSPLRFRSRPPTRNAAGAVQVAQELSADPNIMGVVGHPASGGTLEAIPVYADAEHAGANGLVLLSPTASAAQLSGVSPWFFRVAPSDDDAARVVARWALDSLRATRAAIVYRNDAYGREWMSTVATAFTKRGAAVVARKPYLADVTEWDAYAQLLATLRPDVVFFPGDADDALAMLRALRANGVTAPFVGGDATEQMRQHADARGAYYGAFFRPEQATSAEGRWFVARYRARFQRDPDSFAALAYDATMVMGRTIVRGARTRAALRVALEQIGRSTPAVDGVAGPIAFDRAHDMTGRHVVMVRVDAPADTGKASGAIPDGGAN